MSAFQKIIANINSDKLLPKELELSQFDRVIEFETDEISINNLKDLIDLLNTKTHLLRNTTSISLRFNKLTEIPDFVFAAKKLRKLELKRNNIKVIPDTIKQLHRLEYLDVSDNYLDVISDGILELRELRDLIIHRNQIKSIPKAINQLLHLRSFIAYNNKIKIIPKEILELEELTDLKLNDNRIVNVPDGIFTQRNTMNALRIYFDLIENSEDTSIFYEGKIILLGNGRAGKTTILENLLEPCGLVKHDSTLGLDVEEWELFSIEKQKNIKFRIWDFGGQGKYRSIQQLFATPNAIYLYVGVPEDLKTFEKYGDYRYWLNFVDIVGDKKSPVIFITNKVDLMETDEVYVDRKTIKEEFPIVTKFIDTCFHRSSSSNESIHKIKQAIEKSIHFEEEESISPDHKIVLHELSNKWIHLINTINGMKESKDYITFEDFKELCNDSEIYDSNEIDCLLEYLDKSGVILKYSGQRSFRFHIILNPTWIKKIVFEILKYLELKNRYWFTEDDLKIIWSDYYDQKVYYDEITDLMKELNFSFHIEQKNYIPSLLPTYKVTQQNTFFETKYSVQFSFDPFIPAGLLYRMFFRNTSMFKINNEELYNNRILLVYNNTPIEIIEYWKEGKLLVNIGEKAFLSIPVINDKLQEAYESLEGRNYLSEISIEKEILIYDDESGKKFSYNINNIDNIKNYASVDQLLNKNKNMTNITVHGDYLNKGDKIVNHYYNTNFKDELEELIKKYGKNEEQTEELLEASEILESNLPDKSKKKYVKKLRGFLIQVAEKGGQKLLDLMIESGFEAWL